MEDNYIPKEEDIREYLDDVDKTDHCWETGEFNDDCDCEMCDHRFECSAYEGDDWED